MEHRGWEGEIPPRRAGDSGPRSLGQPRAWSPTRRGVSSRGSPTSLVDTMACGALSFHLPAPRGSPRLSSPRKVIEAHPSINGHAPPMRRSLVPAITILTTRYKCTYTQPHRSTDMLTDEVQSRRNDYHCNDAT
ncbi:Hypothetical protein A7982_05881 [Minicystis rosea]|nr:Hypothetical protein A7982_05881 [Minicystis rosea]